MAAHYSILALSILWTEEPGGLQSMGSQSQTQLGNSAHTPCIYSVPSKRHCVASNFSLWSKQCRHTWTYLIKLVKLFLYQEFIKWKVWDKIMVYFKCSQILQNCPPKELCSFKDPWWHMQVGTNGSCWNTKGRVPGLASPLTGWVLPITGPSLPIGTWRSWGQPALVGSPGQVCHWSVILQTLHGPNDSESPSDSSQVATEVGTVVRGGRYLPKLRGRSSRTSKGASKSTWHRI